MSKLNIHNLEIKIYPLILDKDNGATLWHLVRTLDTKGSGKISLTMNELKEYLSCSKSTVYNLFKSKLFNKVVKTKNKNKVLVYTLYYKSLKQVKELLELPNLLTSSHCFLPFIQNYMDKRRTATEVIAESLQARSLYIAMKNGKQPSIILNDTIWNSEDNSSISDNTQGIKRTPYGIFYDASYYTPYGGSQFTMADILSRSRQTVNRRLKNTQKVQQFIIKPETKAHYAEQVFRDSEEWTNTSQAKFICKFGKVYQRYTNLYKCSFNLSRKKVLYGPAPQAS